MIFERVFVAHCTGHLVLDISQLDHFRFADGSPVVFYTELNQDVKL